MVTRHKARLWIIPLVAVALIPAAAAATAPDPIEPVPQQAFAPIVVPTSTPRLPVIVEPARPAPTKAPVPAPTSKPKLVTPSPRPIPVDQVSDKRWGVVAGSRVARAYARERLSLANYHCLDELWVHESGWRWNAENRYSGAYGIPQALPGSKMKSAGADWRTNPITQVRWGLGYISGRYGDACTALVHWRNRGWY